MACWLAAKDHRPAINELESPPAPHPHSATPGAYSAVLDIEVQRGVGFGHLRPVYLGEYDALYPSYVALRVLRADMHVATGVKEVLN